MEDGFTPTNPGSFHNQHILPSDYPAVESTAASPPSSFVHENLTQTQPTPNDSSLGSIELIDKLTALEMLQLLKEYKKREFLYIAEITMLQKELYLNSNSCVPRPFDLSPLHFYPIEQMSQLGLFDPAVNLEIRELRFKLYEQATELQKAKDELRAATFSADSVMGRRLINKCKALQEENADIGKMMIESRLQPLQIQTGILEKQLAFFKQQLKVLHELNADLDEENERLTQRLQEMTVLYMTTQKEKDAALIQLQKYQNRSSTEKLEASHSYRRSTSHENQRPTKDNTKHKSDTGCKDSNTTTRRDSNVYFGKTKRRESSIERTEKSSGSRRRARSESSR